MIYAHVLSILAFQDLFDALNRLVVIHCASAGVGPSHHVALDMVKSLVQAPVDRLERLVDLKVNVLPGSR